eukprot:jgi/Botrbrau1/22337/Bobra.0002s0016.2
MGQEDDGLMGSEITSDNLAHELEADLEKELAESSGQEVNEPERTMDEQHETQSIKAVEPAKDLGGQTETEDLALVLGLGRNEKDAEALAKAEQNRRNAVKLGLLTEPQLRQFEAFRRSRLDRKTVAKLMQNTTHQPPNPNSVIVVCGVAKMFVGDLIETGKYKLITITLATGRGSV